MQGGQLSSCQVTVGSLSPLTKGHGFWQAGLPVLLSPLHGHPLLSLASWGGDSGEGSPLLCAPSLNVSP